MAKLILRFQETTLQEIALTQSPITIGREPGNDVVIDNLAISRHHVKVFQRDDGQYVIEDLNSGNGTFVNEKQVTKKMLMDRDEILVGKHTLVFVSEEKPLIEERKEKVASLAEGTVLMNPKALAEHRARRAGQQSAIKGQLPRVEGSIVIISGGVEQERIALTQGTTIGGKSHMADIKLRGWFVGNPAFMISRKPEGFFITHSKGKRMTKVNGTAVATQRELRDGDVITVGATEMQFYSGR